MCGFAGILTRAGLPKDTLGHIAETMSARIAHRGPDDQGCWVEPSAGLALGFRRLAIIDLSAHGHQPMHSFNGRFSLVFNGEIYNYKNIRDVLERDGSTFRGHSDTEVICAAFERWGIEAAVRRFVGMFSIAAWDASTRTLSLIRDRLGLKPLFYYHRPGILTFGSELKALAAGPDFDSTVDEDAVAAYLRYLYVPAPRTIYRHARKLLPGSILTVESVGETLPDPRPYWSILDAYRANSGTRVDYPDIEATQELSNLLSQCVREHMEADVPLGALLSGGVDSSIIVALMQANSNRRTRTFSVAFPGTRHDESTYAARIANRLGTDHTELAVTGAEALEVIPILPRLFDEPLADPSQIPTYLVSRLARREVTVALTGDGGDEVFAGYERYVQGERIIRQLNRVPRVVRRAGALAINTLGSEQWGRAYDAVSVVLRKRPETFSESKIRKLGNLLQNDSDETMYRSLLSAWQNPACLLKSPQTSSETIDEHLAKTTGLPLLDRMMLLDQQTYLPDDLLAKVDRASMAVGLEARVPLLDHRVVEFAWRLANNQKIRHGRGKWLLRQVLYKLVEPDLIDRPKMGFTVPIADWLRGPLREWGDDLLASKSHDDSILKMDHVLSAWRRFQSGDNEPALGLWAILMLQAWRLEWLA